MLRGLRGAEPVSSSTCSARAGRSRAIPALPSPPPRCRLSLPAVYAPSAKFPSTRKAPGQLAPTSALVRARGQRPLQPRHLQGMGTEGPRGCHVPVLGSDTPRTHHHGQTSCNCIWGENGRSLRYPRVVKDSLGTSLPLLEHHQASAESQIAGPQCPGGATAGDMSCLCRAWGPFWPGRVASGTCRAPCPTAVGGGWCPRLPRPRGSCPAAPTIINLVRPWQLWLSLIDSVGAEVLGHAGPAASPTSSSVLGKQVPGTALCRRAGRHQGQGWLQLCPDPMGLCGVQRGLGRHCCQEKHHLALAAEEGEDACPGNALYFP